MKCDRFIDEGRNVKKFGGDKAIFFHTDHVLVDFVFQGCYGGKPFFVGHV
tara:strand:+ start:64486 stop:64635 length:150 start_codon:yes stop_codon:yes gene_type:complete